MKRCKHCNGNHMDQRLDAHPLCTVRFRKGLPTPSLGDMCTSCNGEGRNVRESAWAEISCTLGPAAFRMLDVATTTCAVCKGTGTV